MERKIVFADSMQALLSGDTKESKSLDEAVKEQIESLERDVNVEEEDRDVLEIMKLFDVSPAKISSMRKIIEERFSRDDRGVEDIRSTAVSSFSALQVGQNPIGQVNLSVSQSEIRPLSKCGWRGVIATLGKKK